MSVSYFFLIWFFLPKRFVLYMAYKNIFPICSVEGENHKVNDDMECFYNFIPTTTLCLYHWSLLRMCSKCLSDLWLLSCGTKLIEDDWFFPGCSDPAIVSGQQELEEELARGQGIGRMHPERRKSTQPSRKPQVCWVLLRIHIFIAGVNGIVGMCGIIMCVCGGGGTDYWYEQFSSGGMKCLVH